MARVVNRSARQHSLPDGTFINPCASAEIPDDLAKELLSRELFRALVRIGELSFEGLPKAESKPSLKFADLAEGPALVLVRAEESVSQLRTWAKKEKRASVLDAIEARLTELA